VTVLPEGPYNVCSLAKRLLEGWKLSGDEKSISLTKGSLTVRFDIKIHMPKGVLYAVCIKWKTDTANEAVAVATTTETKVNIKQAHDKLGHMGDNLTHKVTKGALSKLYWSQGQEEVNPKEWWWRSHIHSGQKKVFSGPIFIEGFHYRQQVPIDLAHYGVTAYPAEDIWLLHYQ
jgi:hypothetical protein